MAECEAVKSPVREDGKEDDGLGPQSITKLQVIHFFPQQNILKFNTQNLFLN